MHVVVKKKNLQTMNYNSLIMKKKTINTNIFNVLQFVLQQKEKILQKLKNIDDWTRIETVFDDCNVNCNTARRLLEFVMAINAIDEKHDVNVIKKGLIVYFFIIKKYCEKTLCMSYEEWLIQILQLWEKQLQMYLQNGNTTILHCILNHLNLIMLSNDSIFIQIEQLDYNNILNEKYEAMYNFLKTLTTNFAFVITNVLNNVLNKYIICINNSYMYFDKIWHNIGNISTKNVLQKNKSNNLIKKILFLTISKIRLWLENNNLIKNLSDIDLAKIMTIDDNKQLFQDIAIYLINNIKLQNDMYYKKIIDIALTADSNKGKSNLVFSNLLILPHHGNSVIQDIEWKQYIFLPVGSTVHKTAHVEFNYQIEYTYNLSELVLKNIFIVSNGKYEQMLYVCAVLSLCLDCTTEKAILEFCDLMRNGDNGKSKLMQWIVNVLDKYVAIGNIDNFLSSSKKDFDFGSLLNKTMIIFQDTLENYYATFNNRLKAYISEEKTSIKIKHKESVLISINATLVWLHNGLFQLYLSKNIDHTLLTRFEVIWTEYYLGDEINNKFCLKKDENIDYLINSNSYHLNTLQLLLMHGKTMRLYQQNCTKNLKPQWHQNNNNMKLKYRRKDFSSELSDKEVINQFQNLEKFFVKEISQNTNIITSFDSILFIKKVLENKCVTINNFSISNKHAKVEKQILFSTIFNEYDINFCTLSSSQQKFVLKNVLQDSTKKFFYKKIN